MFLSKKSRYNPTFKQLTKLRDNIQGRKRLLKFKKKKWGAFLFHYNRKLKRYKKFKPQNHMQNFLPRYTGRNVGYPKRFRDNLYAGKKLRLFYGGLLKRYFKNQIKFVIKKKVSKSIVRNIGIKLLSLFESRLDTVLYRARFSISIKGASQLISHGKITVNKKLVKSKSYILKSGDIISMDPNFLKVYEINIVESNKWPLPPKHLLINYKTMQILFTGNIEENTLASNFPFVLNLEKILVDYYRYF